MGRARLGGAGSAEGGERLARLFRIGRAERAVQLEKELAELMAKARALVTELRALRRLDDPDPYQEETAGTSTVELRRAPEPGERDYEPHRCRASRSTPAGAARLAVLPDKAPADEQRLLVPEHAHHGGEHPPGFVSASDGVLWFG